MNKKSKGVFMSEFTLETPCILRVHTTPGNYMEVLLPNYASASYSGCEALKNGSSSVEIIPQ